MATGAADENPLISEVRRLSVQLTKLKKLRRDLEAPRRAARKVLKEAMEEEKVAGEQASSIQASLDKKFNAAAKPQALKQVVDCLVKLSRNEDTTVAVLAMNALVRFQESRQRSRSICALCYKYPDKLIKSHVTPNAIIRLMASTMHAPNSGNRLMTADAFSAFMLCKDCEAAKETPGEASFLQLSRRLLKNLHKPVSEDDLLATEDETFGLYHYAAFLFFTGLMWSNNLADEGGRGEELLIIFGLLREWLQLEFPQQAERKVGDGQLKIRLFLLPNLPVTHEYNRIHEALLMPLDPTFYQDDPVVLVAQQHFFWFVAYRARADAPAPPALLVSSAFRAQLQCTTDGPTNAQLRTFWDKATELSPTTPFRLHASTSRASLFPDSFVSAAAARHARRAEVGEDILKELQDRNTNATDGQPHPLMALAKRWDTEQDKTHFEPGCVDVDYAYVCVPGRRPKISIHGTAPLWVVHEAGGESSTVLACVVKAHSGEHRGVFDDVDLPDELAQLQTRAGALTFVREELAALQAKEARSNAARAARPPPRDDPESDSESDDQLRTFSDLFE